MLKKSLRFKMENLNHLYNTQDKAHSSQDPFLCPLLFVSGTEYLTRGEVDFDIEFRGFSPDTGYRCGLAYSAPGLSGSRGSWLVVRLGFNPEDTPLMSNISNKDLYVPEVP